MASEWYVVPSHHSLSQSQAIPKEVYARPPFHGQTSAAITHVVYYWNFISLIMSCYTHLAVYKGMVSRQNTICQTLFWLDCRWAGQQYIFYLPQVVLPPKYPYPVKLSPKKVGDISVLKQHIPVTYHSCYEELIMKQNQGNTTVMRKLTPSMIC